MRDCPLLIYFANGETMIRGHRHPSMPPSVGRLAFLDGTDLPEAEPWGNRKARCSDLSHLLLKQGYQPGEGRSSRNEVLENVECSHRICQCNVLDRLEGTFHDDS